MTNPALRQQIEEQAFARWSDHYSPHSPTSRHRGYDGPTDFHYHSHYDGGGGKAAFVQSYSTPGRRNAAPATLDLHHNHHHHHHFHNVSDEGPVSRWSDRELPRPRESGVRKPAPYRGQPSGASCPVVGPTAADAGWPAPDPTIILICDALVRSRAAAERMIEGSAAARPMSGSVSRWLGPTIKPQGRGGVWLREKEDEDDGSGEEQEKESRKGKGKRPLAEIGKAPLAKRRKIDRPQENGQEGVRKAEQKRMESRKPDERGKERRKVEDKGKKRERFEEKRKESGKAEEKGKEKRKSEEKGAERRGVGVGVVVQRSNNKEQESGRPVKPQAYDVGGSSAVRRSGKPGRG